MKPPSEGNASTVACGARRAHSRSRALCASSARGKGIARLLYADLFAAAKQAGHDRGVCEVNIDPPNPASEAFHAAMGFDAIGEATIHNGTKTVRYFEKTLR